ncbi:hypothetical protein D915_001697 [Fasciola hepatica]|uniref:Trematode PH-like domain-containing protein n=1 Tax=Fasciola hepatica TaxID=6192 RepID=A0A4E0RIX4_FASHE|nr:hypothetical protein D915_001697 [Fasciola hepatica]
MPKARSRSRSKARTYTVLGNQTVDARSKQILFNEFEICTMGRTVLKGDEIFTEGTANSLLEKHMKTKKPVGYVNFLIDRMRFGKQSGVGSASNREYLTYREIKQLYTFLSRPNVFMLCVEEEATGKRSYETYMCKNVDDLARIQELIKQSTSDPQFMLRSHNAIMNPMVSTVNEKEPIPKRSGASDNDLIYRHVDPVYRTQNSNTPVTVRSAKSSNYLTYTENRMTHQQTSPNRTVSMEYPVTAPYDSLPSDYGPREIYIQSVTPNRQSRVVPIRASTPTVVFTRPVQSRIPSPSPEPAKDDYLYRNSRVISTKQRSRPSGVEKVRARSLNSEPDTMNTFWRDDLTYLVPNKSDGPEVANRGSVYLYVSRSKRNDTAATNSTDSIPRYSTASHNGYYRN